MMQPPRPARRSKVGPLAAAACAALLLLLFKKQTGSQVPQISVEVVDDAEEVAERAARRPAPDADSPWPKRKTINDLETLWELPPEDPRGVLFVAHGCNHQGSDFWPRSPRCQHCLGLPEEMLVRATAMAQGYAVIAVTSYNRESKCWHNTQASKSNDLQRVPKILKRVMKEEGLQHLPLFVLGASSGGGFVLRLAQMMPEVQGVTCQINPVNPDVLDAGKGRRYPPTLFVHMALRDPEKAETVRVALKVLKKQGVPTDEIRIEPQPVTPEFLQRSPQISAEMARAIVEALSKHKFIDKEGFLEEDPRKTAYQWREVVQPVVGDLSLQADVSQVTELLNVAYARHELVSDTTNASLAWMEAGGTKSVESLLQRDRQRDRQRLHQ